MALSPYGIAASATTFSTAHTTLTVTAGADTTTGDAIVVCVVNNNTAVTAVTDSQGNTYVQAADVQALYGGRGGSVTIEVANV